MAISNLQQLENALSEAYNKYGKVNHMKLASLLGEDKMIVIRSVGNITETRLHAGSKIGETDASSLLRIFGAMIDDKVEAIKDKLKEDGIEEDEVFGFRFQIIGKQGDSIKFSVNAYCLNMKAR